MEHWSLTTLGERLVKIGAKVIDHGHYFTFQLVVVAISRALCADVLRLISARSSVGPMARVQEDFDGGRLR